MCAGPQKYTDDNKPYRLEILVHVQKYLCTNSCLLYSDIIAILKGIITHMYFFPKPILLQRDKCSVQNT